MHVIVTIYLFYCSYLLNSGKKKLDMFAEFSFSAVILNDLKRTVFLGHGGVSLLCRKVVVSDVVY